MLIPLCGSLKVELTDGHITETYHLKEDNAGLFIPVNIWLKMFEYSKDCIICVICSYEYDETEYIRNYGDFLEYVQTLDKDKIQCFDLGKQTTALSASIL